VVDRVIASALSSFCSFHFADASALTNISVGME